MRTPNRGASLTLDVRVGERSCHCREDEYGAFMKSLSGQADGYERRKLNEMRRFVRRWPDLADWFQASLAVRVGALYSRGPEATDARISHFARGYLLFLGLRGHARFDYPWLLASRPLFLPELAQRMQLELGVEALKADAVRLGFGAIGIDGTLRWSLSRLVLHTGYLDPRRLRSEHIDEFRQAVEAFLKRPDLTHFYPNAECKFESFRKTWTLRVNQLELLLFHRGQVSNQPRKVMRSIKERRPTPPRMQAVVDRWLAARRLTDRSVKRFELALYRFMVWLAHRQPAITNFADVDRAAVLEYVAHLAEQPSPRTGRPLGVLARRNHISAVSQFFSNTAAWAWDDVPARPLLGVGDLPRMPMRVPRFIPDDELERLMRAVATLECPYQHAALLIARWTGARKGEIQRLSVDCLDSYPDGTPRLRLPAGKTYRERVVPMHEEAAAPLRHLIALRAEGKERAFIDELTGTPTQYVFMSHGRLLSCTYLFQKSLTEACQAAGLVDGAGRRTISAHRFRHTVGTQLAERGAKLHTIMSVLGHRSASMSLVYAQISDKEVLRDYKAVLGPGAIIAGPGAESLRSATLPDSAVDWLKCNFFKTELELGHCLRLPGEGPCECDLFLSCAKFVTTPAYAPRLRERRKVELALAKDAQEHGWSREVDRHRATVARIAQLLTDLSEPLESSAEAEESTCHAALP